MLVCVFFSCPLLLSFPVGRAWAIRSECNIEQVEFTDLMPLLPSELMEKIDVNPETFHQGLH